MQPLSGVQGLLTFAEIIPYESDPGNSGVESMNIFNHISMKKLYAVVAMIAAAQMSFAQEAKQDSSKLQALNEVVVSAVKAPANAPFAVTKIDGKELESFSRTGRELPFLFARTPGVIAWSENGVGTGTTYMRMRGAGDSRINVTLDGVALNSPEDQCVFWANMNSYASLLSNVQIQRGVGSSTNGDGAFGGSIALTSKFPDTMPSADLNFSYGSFNTMNFGGRASTGLLWNHLILDGAYHETRTDGFLHGTSGRSGSYYGGLTWLNTAGTMKISYKHIGNFERTGQAWNGVTAGDDNLSLMDGIYGNEGFKSYKDMWNAGYGRFNSLYERFVFDKDAWAFVKNPDGTIKTERYTKKDGTLWDKTTDNFWQNHNLLNFSWRINEHWSASATLHYTYGHGYYDEFRYDNKLKKYGLSTFIHTDGTKLKSTDFVRQKGLTQHTGGLTWNFNYRDTHWDITAGAAQQYFEGNHYGYLTYVKDDELEQALFNGGNKYQYYDSDARKGDHSVFAKAQYYILPCFSAFADLQYRYVNYRTDGYNDKYIDNGDGTYSKHMLDINKEYNFLNPKVGLSFNKNGHSAYASYALGHREPERNNFTDNGLYPAPKAESVHDIEIGYGYHSRRWFASLGMYAMFYDNQFVQTGAESEIGEKLTTNVKSSYRVGLEASAGVNVTKWLSLEANAALSQNKIEDFDEVVEHYTADWDDLDPITNHYNNSTLAYSPSLIANGFIDFHHRGFQATWHTGYVSRQYLDNTECKERSLDAFTRTDISLSYDLKCWQKGLRHIIFGLNFNNIFNARYAQSGWVYSAILEGLHPNDNRYYQIGYIPAAGFNMMGSIALKF